MEDNLGAKPEPPDPKQLERRRVAPIDLHGAGAQPLPVSASSDGDRTPKPRVVGTAASPDNPFLGSAPGRRSAS